VQVIAKKVEHGLVFFSELLNGNSKEHYVDLCGKSSQNNRHIMEKIFVRVNNC
jgi:hypothetical protein